MPLPITNIDGGGVIDTSEYSSFNSGLTKREHFALEIFKAIIIGNNADDSALGEGAAIDSIESANILLVALESKQ